MIRGMNTQSMFTCSNTYVKYLESLNDINLHEKQVPIVNTYHEKYNVSNNSNHFIFYGPNGTGKYSQVLNFLSYYSPSKLGYEKKMIVPLNKSNEYISKISDIHYEIDMSLLGCNSKCAFNIIYHHILDTITYQSNTHCKTKIKFIVCKEFHKVHPELLEIMYSYITNTQTHVPIYFIFISEVLSSIPSNILNICEVIRFTRPHKTSYSKIAKTKLKGDVSDIDNIMKFNIQKISVIKKQGYEPCNDIIKKIQNIKQMDLFSLRESIYKLLIMQLDIEKCIFYIIVNVVVETKHVYDICNALLDFYKYYYNNYRCIYHLEKLFLTITKIIHEI